jgi:hypothetical protein
VTGPSPNLVPTLASIQQEIFETTDLAGRNSCVSCHTNVGRVPPMGLVLTDGNAYANLVGVASRERPALQRVNPGDPVNSYLIHKLAAKPGIVGVQMPFQGTPLTTGQIRVIERWIELGAPNN